MADVTFTMEGVDQLVADLTRAGDIAPVEVRPAVRTWAEATKGQARQLATGIGHAPMYPYAIGYSTFERADGAEAEVGPDKGLPQGALGNILEYGTVNNPPHAHLGPALDLTAPLGQEAIEAVARGLL